MPFVNLAVSNTQISAVLKDGLTSVKVTNSPDMRLKSPEIVWWVDNWITLKKMTTFGLYRPRLPTLNAETYIRECLEPHVIPYADYVGPNFLFMHDNARAHAAGIVREYLRGVNITVMDTARSPDMNPIEHMWDELKRRVKARQPVAQTMQELKTAIEEEWEMIPQNFIERLINSMPNRMRAVVDAHGGNTRY
ncbi:hypothetical protein evm_004620 [Chilo suppressalis]|nr:hypothetical protein evm_004620 [Chilo suppressalis]